MIEDQEFKKWFEVEAMKLTKEQVSGKRTMFAKIVKSMRTKYGIPNDALAHRLAENIMSYYEYGIYIGHKSKVK